MTLEREDAGAFAPLRWPGEKPYTDSGLRIMVDYLGRWGHKNPADDSPDEHPWELRWKEVADFPPGRYRFVAHGRHWTGEATEPYEAVSRTFDLSAASEMAVLEPTSERVTTGLSRQMLDSARPAGSLQVIMGTQVKEVQKDSVSLKTTIVANTNGIAIGIGYSDD